MYDRHMLPNLLMALLDGAILVVATLRLVRLFIADDLGRRMLIPLETRLRGRLSEGKQWVADGFTCPFCLGMWIGLVSVLLWYGADAAGGGVLVTWRILFGALALNYVVAHLAARLDIYDDQDDQEDDR
jgi:hypothetical protein